MVQKVSPFLQSAWGWDFGEANWNDGMDLNILKFSFLHEANVDGIVSELPSSPVNGSAYFLTGDNRFYFRVDGFWRSVSCPKWFVFQDKLTGDKYQYSGTEITPVPSEEYLVSKFGEIDGILDSLGSAAYEPVESFASPSYVDISVAGVSDSVSDLEAQVIRDLYAFGAVGDGVADDTAAIQSAVNSGCFRVSAGRYRITSTGITATNPVKILGDSPEDCVFIPDVGAASAKVFLFLTNDVFVSGVSIDGDGIPTASTGNHYAFFSGDGVEKFKNHTYDRCAVKNWQFRESDLESNLSASHGIYVDNVDNVKITNNEFTDLVGAAVFTRDTSLITISKNKMHNCQWYPIHVAGGMYNGEISFNSITCDLPSGIYWGGAIDLMNQHIPLENRSKGVHIFGNDISGVISYGAAIRILSCEDIWCYGNKIHDWSQGTWGTSNGASGIRVDTRGTAVGSENGPCKNVNLMYNQIEAPVGGATNYGIYISNQFQSSRNTLEKVAVVGNLIRSLNTTSFFVSGIIFHGFSGGIEDVTLSDNWVSTVVGGTAAVPGGLGFIATNTDGLVNRINITGNTLADLGTPATSAQVGISVGAYTNNLSISETNTVSNYFYGIRTFANSGPNLRKLLSFVSNNTNKGLLAVPEVDVYGLTAVPSIASSSALSIPSFQGASKAFKVTGTTTINSAVASNHPGQIVTLIFTSTILVNDSNQLKLAGALNATANSTLTIVSDGTDWFEISRSIN